MSRLEAALAELAEAIRAEVRAEAAPFPSAPDPLLSVADAARLLGIGRSRLYDEIGRGDLRTIKVGRRRLIPTSSVEKFIQLAVNAPSVVLPSTTGTAGVPRPQRRPSVVPDSDDLAVSPGSTASGSSRPTSGSRAITTSCTGPSRPRVTRR
jgi:excisionase family DNA binding protein